MKNASRYENLVLQFKKKTFRIDIQLKKYETMYKIIKIKMKYIFKKIWTIPTKHSKTEKNNFRIHLFQILTIEPSTLTGL